jgi:hypothetical protein
MTGTRRQALALGALAWAAICSPAWAIDPAIFGAGAVCAAGNCTSGEGTIRTRDGTETTGSWSQGRHLEGQAYRVRSPLQPGRTTDMVYRSDGSPVRGTLLRGDPLSMKAPIGEFTGKGPTPDEFKWGVDTMRTVAEHAAQAGVTIATEYLNRFENYFLTSVAQTVTFVQAVDHPNVRMMYDTFHANIEEKNLASAIQAAAPWTVLVHISENDRSIPGTGHVHWDETFDALHAAGYGGWMVVEAFGLALPNIVAATKIWRKMFPSENQLATDSRAFMKKHVAKRG